MQNQVKIKTGRSLSAIIDAVVNESIKAQLYNNAVEEKQKQLSLHEEEDDSLDTSGSTSSSQSKTMEDETEKLKSGDVKSEDVIDKLNAIRAGKSFKDEVISKRLEEYIGSLKKAEKVALLAFLKGISQIVTGEVEADDAVEPADPASDVEMKKGASVQKKTIKPNVISKPSKTKKEDKSTEEDTSGPVPITPKK